jgi:hypothetical protein
MENKELKVGDKLVLSHQGCHRVQTIVEITKAGNYKLDNKQIIKKNMTLYGESNVWYSTTVSIYDKQWAFRFEHWKRYDKAKKFFDKMDSKITKKNFDFIKKVNELIEEYEKEK